MLRLLLLLVGLSIASGAFTQTLPQYFSRQAVGGTISVPSAMAFAPDGRIFIAQQSGALRIIKADALLATPFVSVTVNSAGERGLLGIAFDPDFATNNYVYVYYTVATVPIHNRISRFTANGDVAVPGSEQVILELDDLSSATNHNGGAIAFGHDGKLYVAIGENANTAHAQNLDTYHGKFLRINKDGSAPSDNPFPTGSEQRKRVWSYGLRNPFTFSVHPTSGRIFLNDVGQVSVEEVNDATTAGKNFGWPATEGPTSNASYTSPVYSYLHSGPAPTGCAITGGIFYSTSAGNYPSSFQGKYFIMDLCSEWIYWFDPDVSSPTATLFGSSIGGQSVALTVGTDGNLYYLSRSNSRLYRILYTPPTAPTVTTQPLPASLYIGQTLVLSVTANGTAPLAYQWQKDGVDVAGAVQSTLTISNVQLSHAGNYAVRVTNTMGSVYSNLVAITVQPPPIAPQITTQPAPITVEAGQLASFSVVATGTAPLAYQWQKAGVNINGANASTYTIASATFADAGSYRVTVTNAGGSITSLGVDLVVNPVNQKPVAAILIPAPNSTYRAGEKISFVGGATDAEDGQLPASAFQWRINFHHDTHKHDQPPLTGIVSGDFDVPDRGETSSNVWYRFILTVTDSKGLKDVDSVDVVPKKSTLQFRTQPAGLPVILDGQPLATPADIVSVVGLKRDINAATEQQLNGNTYAFSSWSIGGGASQTITTPENNLTYTAVYSIVLSTSPNAVLALLYPNPASDKLYFTGEIDRLDAVDAMGRRFELIQDEGASAFDISALAPGIYAIHVQTADVSFVRRIIISR